MNKGTYKINQFIQVDKNLYFVPANMNIFVEYSTENNEESKILDLPECSFKGINPYLGIARCGDRIVVIPNHADKFLVYNIGRNEMLEISIPMDGIDCNPWGYFSEGFEYDNKLFVVGNVYPGIVKLNLEKQECLITVNISDGTRGKNGCCFSSPVCIGDTIYTLIIGENRILSFSMKTETVDYIEIGQTQIEQALSLSSSDNSLWILFDDGSLRTLDTTTLKETYYMTEMGPYLKDNEYKYMAITGNSLYVGADNEAPILKLSLDDPVKVDTIWKEGVSGLGYSIYGFSFSCSFDLLFLDKKGFKNYAIDSKSGSIAEFSLFSDTNRIISMGLISNDNVFQERDMSLSEFLTYLVND